MNEGQRNKFNMYNRVVDFLLAWTAVTAKFPGFPAIFEAFRGYITQIFDLNEAKVTKKKSGADVKTTMRAQLVAQILKIVDICHAYAVVEEDSDFDSLTWFTPSDISTSTDVDLIDKGQAVLAAARTKIEKLKIYFLSDDDFDVLQQLITKFTEIFPKPEANQESGTGDTAALDAVFEKADVQLNKLDALFRLVRLTDRAFYVAFTAVRKILKTGYHKRSLEIWVKDEHGQPIENAKVFIEPKDANGSKKSKKKTGKRGGIYQKNMNPAEYTYRIVFEGLPDSTGSFAIHEGKMTKIVVVMKKG